METSSRGSWLRQAGGIGIATVVITLLLSPGGLAGEGRATPGRRSGDSHSLPGGVLESRFGLQENGVIRSQDEPVVPLRDGVVYGWAIRLRRPIAPMQVTERLELPGKAQWNIDADYPRTISPDGKTCLMQMNLTPDAEGWISNTWNVSGDDPEGKGRCTVTIAGQPPVEFPVTFVRDHPGEAKTQSNATAQPTVAETPAARPVVPPVDPEKASLQELGRQLEQPDAASRPSH